MDDLRTHDLVTVLVGLFELEYLPEELWAYRAVIRGLWDAEASTRELALSVLATSTVQIWTNVLQLFILTEPEAWLLRYACFIIEEQEL